MNVKDFISQLKSLKPGKQRVEFLKQHLQDGVWLDVVKNKSYALQIFRYCCTSSDINTCVGVFDILVQKGCFMRIIQKFDETHVINNNILSILKICPQLLGSWFSGPLKFETSDAFFTFLYNCSKYSGNLNLAGNIEQFLKYDTIKLFNFYSLQSALTKLYKYNKQTYNYILKLIDEANTDIIKSFNSNHKVEGDIKNFILGVPEICVLLKPPFIFDNITVFVYMMWHILSIYEKKPHDTRILKYFIVYTCAENEQVFIDSDIINTRLSSTQTDVLAGIVFELLNKNHDDLVEYICNQLLQTDIGKQCIINIYSILETHYAEEYGIEMLQVLYPYAQKALAVGGITADDIKDLFDI